MRTAFSPTNPKRERGLCRRRRTLSFVALRFRPATIFTSLAILIGSLTFTALPGCGEERRTRIVPAARSKSTPAADSNRSDTMVPPRAIPTH
jgi:hypothetical protein